MSPAGAGCQSRSKMRARLIRHRAESNSTAEIGQLLAADWQQIRLRPVAAADGPIATVAATPGSSRPRLAPTAAPVPCSRSQLHACSWLDGLGRGLSRRAPPTGRGRGGAGSGARPDPDDFAVSTKSRRGTPRRPRSGAPCRPPAPDRGELSIRMRAPGSCSRSDMERGLRPASASSLPSTNRSSRR